MQPDAEVEWNKLGPDGPSLELKIAIKAGLVAWMACEQWRKGLIAHPNRWLRNGEWKTEPPSENTKENITKGSSKNGRSGNRGSNAEYRPAGDDPLAGRREYTEADAERERAEREAATIAEY